MTVRKKALFLTHTPPYPLVGGDRIRIAQQLRLLLEHYDVDVIYLSHERVTRPLSSFEPRIGHEWNFQIPRLMRYLHAARWLFNRKPEIVNHFHHPHVQRFISERLADYDLVFCASPVMASYLERHPGIRRYADIVDSLTMNYTAELRHAETLMKPFRKREVSRMRRYETWIRQNFTRSAYISEADRDYLGLDPGDACVVCNAVPPVPPDEYALHDPEARDLVFVGKMDYEPNVLAVTNFARNVLPLVKGVPDRYQFVAVGANPVPAVSRLDALPGVTVTGFVPSVSPYLRNARVVVAPMLSGSGIQNKILQAMATGCCVATTPAGLCGIEALADGLVLLPEEPTEMAACLNRLLADDGLIRRTGEKARALIAENFSEQRARTQFQDFIL